MFNYDEPIDFKKNKIMEFQDLTLEYLGERKIAVPEYVGKFFLYNDFKVTSGDQTANFSDTSGTGNIGIHKFQLGDNYFTFENMNGAIIRKITSPEFNELS